MTSCTFTKFLNFRPKAEYRPRGASSGVAAGILATWQPGSPGPKLRKIRSSDSDMRGSIVQLSSSTIGPQSPYRQETRLTNDTAGQNDGRGAPLRGFSQLPAAGMAVMGASKGAWKSGLRLLSLRGQSPTRARAVQFQFAGRDRMGPPIPAIYCCSLRHHE
jgi:hypothetical protein